MNNKAVTRYTKTITKIYPNKLVHTTLKHPVISDGQNLPRKTDSAKKSIIEQKISDDENLERSLRRTQKEISDLIECNPFDWFGTFTFDPRKINRYDYTAVKTFMTKFLNNLRRQSPNMTYILVPERHKDGAIHFHALIGNFNGEMADSGSKWQKETIFNMVAYQKGFTNFTKIRNKSKTANYCRKYITKEMINTAPNQKRYWRSKNLKTPEKLYNLSIVDALNLSDHKKITSDVLSAYENKHVSTFTLKLLNPITPLPLKE